MTEFECDHVAGGQLGAAVPTRQQPYVFVVTRDYCVLTIAVILSDAVVHLGRPVDDHDEFDVVVRLREDAVGGLAEVFVHVQRVRTDDDRDLHTETLSTRVLRVSASPRGRNVFAGEHARTRAADAGR
jgi:hypothetical protein